MTLPVDGTTQPLTGRLEISAIIPTYNRADLLPRAIASVLEQSLPPAEVIVVDDGSTDATESVVRQFGAAVHYVRQENQGGASARNRGVQEATCAWIAFLDSDDVWTETHLERIVHAIQDTGGAAVLYFDDMLLPDAGDGTWWSRGGFSIPSTYLIVSDGSDWALREYQPMMLQTSVCHRTTFLEEGGLWAKLHNAHDTHFFLKLGIGRPVCAVEGIGCRQTADAPGISRLTSASLQRRRFQNRTIAFRDILRKKSHLAPSQRSCLRWQVASSFWTLGRMAWEERRPLRCCGYLLRSVMTDPPAAARFAVQAVRNRRGHTTQPREAPQQH